MSFAIIAYSCRETLYLPLLVKDITEVTDGPLDLRGTKAEVQKGSDPGATKPTWSRVVRSSQPGAMFSKPKVFKIFRDLYGDFIRSV